MIKSPTTKLTASKPTELGYQEPDIGLFILVEKPDNQESTERIAKTEVEKLASILSGVVRYPLSTPVLWLGRWATVMVE